MLLSRPAEQTDFISNRASEIAALNPLVEVSGLECFDSIPNLITSGPVRSAPTVNR